MTCVALPRGNNRATAAIPSASADSPKRMSMNTMSTLRSPSRQNRSKASKESKQQTSTPSDDMSPPVSQRRATRQNIRPTHGQRIHGLTTPTKIRHSNGELRTIQANSSACNRSSSTIATTWLPFPSSRHAAATMSVTHGRRRASCLPTTQASLRIIGLQNHT